MRGGSGRVKMADEEEVVIPRVRRGINLKGLCVTSCSCSESGGRTH